MPPPPRTCSVCTQPYQPRTQRQRTCSTRCSVALTGRRKRIRHGTTSSRGYDAAHKRTRAQWKPIVQAGEAYCWRPNCLYRDTPTGRWIPPDTPGQPTGWHVGHDDHDRSIVHGPEHAACNLRHGAIKGNRQRGQRWTSSAPRIAG